MNGQILQQYKDHVWANHKNKHTRQTYISHVDTFLRTINKPVAELTQEDVNEYLTHMQNTRKPNGNCLRFWVIRQFLKWANRSELHLPSITPEDSGKTALPGNEMQKIFDLVPSLSPLHQLITYLETDAILRPFEIRNLHKKCLYRDLLTLNTKRGVKTKVVTQRLIDAWHTYINIQRPLPLNDEEDQYLILNTYTRYRGQRIRWNGYITKIIREVLMHCDVELPPGEKPTSYLIKRSTITQQLKHCPDPKIIMVQAGHSKLRTTMKYNRIDEDHIRNYVSSYEHKSHHINTDVSTYPHKNYLAPSKRSPDNQHKRTLSSDGTENTVSVTVSLSLYHHDRKGFDFFVEYIPSHSFPNNDCLSCLPSLSINYSYTLEETYLSSPPSKTSRGNNENAATAPCKLYCSCIVSPIFELGGCCFPHKYVDEAVQRIFNESNMWDSLDTLVNFPPMEDFQ